MLRLEARPQPSKLMSLLSPLLALVLTAIIAALLFVALGKDPVARPEHVLRRAASPACARSARWC